MRIISSILYRLRFRNERHEARVLLDLTNEIFQEMSHYLIPPKELEDIRIIAFKLERSVNTLYGWTAQEDGFRPNDILILKLWILLRRMDAIEVQGSNKKSIRLLRLQERFGREYGIGLFWERV